MKFTARNKSAPDNDLRFLKILFQLNMLLPLRMGIFVIEPNAVISKQIAPMQV